MERTHQVAGRRLALRRSGSGGPAVVFLPGAGLVGLDFVDVQERVAEFTTSVVYDRAGTGWSDPVALPRSAAGVAGELRELLRVAGVPGPYVLVGHSLGAFYARRFAQLHGDEVAGLVLVDPGHEDINDHVPSEAVALSDQAKPDAEALPDLDEEQIRAAGEQLGRLYADFPEEARDALVEHHLSSWRTGVQETANFETEIYDELRGGGALPDVPLVVLTADGVNPYWAQILSEDLLRGAHEGLRALHAAMAAAVPRGEQRIMAGASHQYAHIECPEAVVDAVRDVIAARDAVRRG
ncbi:alpha/beta hydrolase [Actinomadura kijaniata]|uniref:Pimeloyl-ACP methyl ester carboxylesterase n=1 Tax=Actinomadura namibiensis TaxID=182080 RepID=A0A7W3LYD0_ACTNM|nr:alpha/beta hydrolase [Actinomadura namibiensis]MBA8956452.1 pimeloyl-ACP methyl ester carboxylesterase [Actinomadura namibiensis]